MPLILILIICDIPYFKFRIQTYYIPFKLVQMAFYVHTRYDQKITVIFNFFKKYLFIYE